MRNTLNLSPKVPSSYRLNIVHKFKVSSKFPGNLINVSFYKITKISNVLSAYNGTEKTVYSKKEKDGNIVREDQPQ